MSKKLSVKETKAAKKEGFDEFKKFVHSMQGKYPEGTIMMMGTAKAKTVPVIHTGSLAVDLAFGCGGMPRGKVMELWGAEGAGKSTMASHLVAEAQKEGGRAAYIDVEQAMDPAYMTNIGVDIDELLFIQPDSGEEALDIAMDVVESGQFSILVIDSVAALVPQAEIDGDIADQQIGLQARMMGKFLRKAMTPIAKAGIAVVCINQTRMIMNAPKFSDPTTTPGGKALKYYAQLRVQVSKLRALKGADDEVRGTVTQVYTKKNKFAPPYRKAEFDIIYGRGIYAGTDVIDTGLKLEILTKKGNTVEYNGEVIGVGRDSAAANVMADAELCAKLTATIRAEIESRRGPASAAAAVAEQVYEEGDD